MSLIMEKLFFFAYFQDYLSEIFVHIKLKSIFWKIELQTVHYDSSLVMLSDIFPIITD